MQTKNISRGQVGERATRYERVEGFRVLYYKEAATALRLSEV
jgi:hypothetical protein